VSREQGKEKLCCINVFEGLFETAEEKWEIISQEAYSVSHKTFIPFTLPFCCPRLLAQPEIRGWV
jgi:hypothetical protein